MTRHGKRGTDGDQGQEQWRASDYGRTPRRADARSEYRAAAWDNVAPADPRHQNGAVGTSSDPGSMRWDDTGQRWDRTGPPWELPGWDEEAASRHPSAPLPPHGRDLNGGHPSAPLPPRGRDLNGGHPSAPLPRVTGPLSSPPPGDLPPAWPDSQPSTSSGPMPRVSSSGPLPRVSSSGPMPRVSSSGPMPAVPGDPLSPLPPSGGGWDTSGGDYPGRSFPGPRASHTGYPGDDDPYGDSGGFPAGDEQSYRGRHGPGGYPPSDYPAGGQYPDAGYGQPGAGYADGEPGYAPDGYPGSGPGYSEPGYGADPLSGGSGYRGEDGFPTEIGYQQDGAYPGHAGYQDTGYQDTGYQDTGYRDGYAGAGYPGEDEYQGADAYAAQPGYAGDPRYPDQDYPPDAGYAGGGDFAPAGDPYPGYQAPARRGAGDPGYTDQGDWYGDVDEDQDWGDDGYEEGFVPGLGDDRAMPERAGRRGSDQGPRGSDQGPRGGAGGRAPAKQRKTAKRKTGKRKSGVRRAAPVIAVAVLFFILCVAGAAYYYVWRTYLHPADYSGPGTGTVEVVIAKGETATDVGQVLLSKGVVASARAFSNAAKDSGHGTSLEPGTFRLHLHMQASLAFKLLLSASARVQSKAALPEGLRLTNIIAVLGKATGDLAGYKAAIKEIPQLGLPPYAHGNPQGYLFPDTYTIQHGTPPLKVLQEMVNAFNQEATKVNLVAQAKQGNITPAEVITVASLVQAEGGQTSDYPKIAEVIYNRLNQKPPVPLQLDSTVMFALHKYGILATTAELKTKSPYNTYQNTGLPPGPIDSPGDAAIKAALHPAHGTLMYFVTVDPAHRITKFTSSFAEFTKLKAELEKNLAKGN